MGKSLLKGGDGEGPKGYGSYHTDLEALFSRLVNGVFGNSGGNAEGNNAYLGVVHEIFLKHGNLFFHRFITLIAGEIELLKLLGNEGKRIHYVVGTAHFRAGGGPRLFGGGLYVEIKLNRLHHLSHGAVGHYHGGHAVFVGKLKALDGQLGHFLNRGGSENYHVKIAVGAALGGLEIVRLAGLNSAESGAAALNVYHESRKVASGKVGKSFALKGNSGA